MGYALDNKAFASVCSQWSKTHDIYGPMVFEGTGRFSETDVVRYGKVTDPSQLVWNAQSDYSFKDILTPICQVLFYFTEHSVQEAELSERGVIVFLRSCDLHAVKRLDYMFLQHGPEDYYYKQARDRIKFVLIGCDHSFEECFCVSMGTNKSDNYDCAINVREDSFEVDCKDEFLGKALQEYGTEIGVVTPDSVTEDPIPVHIPENLTSEVAKSSIWDEYDKRCINCGRCTLVCPSCTCWSMQDIFYTENGNAGERRRIQTSCMFNDYTVVAGGGRFRQKPGERMRFKVLHKVLEFKKGAGYNMCVGCGRCDAICPEYISIKHCINEKLPQGMKEVEANG